MRLDPVTTFLIVLVIGVVAGMVFDRVAGPGWFTRQIAGQNRHMLTSALIGIAGAFIGFHVAVLLGFLGLAAIIGAALGAVAVLWLWRTIK